MFSRRNLSLALPFLLVVSAVVSCGRKEPPQPPPLMVAAQTTDLQLKQRGSEVLLTFTYPTLTPAGLALPQVEAVEIWEYERPLALGLAEPEPGEEAIEGLQAVDEEGAAAEPADKIETDETVEIEAPFSLFGAPPTTAEEGEVSGGDQAEEVPAAAAPAEIRPEAEVRVDPREFATLAQLRLTVQGPELAASILGDRVVARLPLEEPGAVESALVFGIRVLSGKKLASAYSNLGVLIPRATPEPPQEVQVAAKADGVEIAWKAGAEGLAGYHVYRREAQSPFYGEPIYLLAPEADRYLDSGAVFGRRYIYSVTGVVAAETPVIESGLSAELELDYKDRFPPPPPANPLALAEPARVRLLWDESPATDLAGYRVFRREAGGDFEPLTDTAVLSLELLDTATVSGRRYSYHVRAVDRSGNESEPSEQVEVLVP